LVGLEEGAYNLRLYDCELYSVSSSMDVFMDGTDMMHSILYSSAYTSGLSGAHGMTVELGVSNSTISLLGLTTYLFGMAAGSMIWAPLSVSEHVAGILKHV
jgi:hypothetical protein